MLVHQCAAKSSVEDKSNSLQERHEVIASNQGNHRLNEEVRVFGNPTSTQSVTSHDVTSISCASHMTTEGCGSSQTFNGQETKVRANQPSLLKTFHVGDFDWVLHLKIPGKTVSGYGVKFCFFF